MTTYTPKSPALSSLSSLITATPSSNHSENFIGFPTHPSKDFEVLATAASEPTLIEAIETFVVHSLFSAPGPSPAVHLISNSPSYSLCDPRAQACFRSIWLSFSCLQN